MAPLPKSGEPCEERAATYYRPEYERLRWGGRTLHLFWFRDRNGRRTHQMVLRQDPREPARDVRADLAQLSKGEFEARYAAYRLDASRESGEAQS
jgi:hypothetical protein